MQLIKLMGSVFGIVFVLWPLAVGGSLIKGSMREARWAWVVIFVGWLFTKTVKPLPSFLIPEPLNTYLFFVMGLILFTLKFFAREK